jgi:tyrosinase
MKEQNPFTRRDFLKAAGISTAAIAMGACESWCTKIKNRPTRRNIANLAPNDPIIQTYQDAVTKMQQLPSSDGRNWTKQAEIHQNHCPHGNWWFLPWHRAYLFNFENIIRKLTGNADFALPYWNWTTSPSIPAPFWSGSLLDANRTANQSSQASTSVCGATNIQNNVLSETNFFLFASAQATGQRDKNGYGALEGGPHNYVHGFVGGDMGTYMSPLDPVFWCHHNMIECLWVDWNINKGNANTNDTAWSNFTFNDFVDGDGNPAPIQVATTLLMPLLSYQFEPCAPGATLTSKDRATLEKFLREGAPYKLEYGQRYELRQSLDLAVGKPAAARLKVEPEALVRVLDASARQKAVLTIDEVQVPPKQDVFVRVFINKPDASKDTSIEDPHYAGSFAFFCCEDPHALEVHDPTAAPNTPKLRYLVDASKTVQRLAQGGSLSADLDISLVVVPIEEQRPIQTQKLTLGRVELATAAF